MDTAIIKECMLQFPEAVSEVEAVDLAAQQVHRSIREGAEDLTYKQVQRLCSKYNYLHALREELNEQRIEEMSSFVVLN